VPKAWPAAAAAAALWGQSVIFGSSCSETLVCVFEFVSVSRRSPPFSQPAAAASSLPECIPRFYYLQLNLFLFTLTRYNSFAPPSAYLFSGKVEILKFNMCREMFVLQISKNLGCVRFEKGENYTN